MRVGNGEGVSGGIGSRWAFLGAGILSQAERGLGEASVKSGNLYRLEEVDRACFLDGVQMGGVKSPSAAAEAAAGLSECYCNTVIMLEIVECLEHLEGCSMGLCTVILCCCHFTRYTLNWYILASV